MTSSEGGAKASEPVLLIATWTLFSIAVAFFVARITIRLKYSGRVFIDDSLAFFAICCLLVNALLVTIMTPSMYATLQMEKLAGSFGIVKRQNLFETISHYMKLQLSQTIVFWTCLWAVKASFLAFFKRLTFNLKPYIAIWWIIVVITALAYVGCVVTYPIACSSFQPLVCGHPQNVRLALISLRFSTAMDILTDLLIIGLPMSLTMRVRLPVRSRIALVGVVALGGIIIVFSVIRIIMTNTHDKRPEVSWLNLWSGIEAGVACIVCSLAPFKVLFKSQMRNRTSDSFMLMHNHTSDSYNMNRRPYAKEEKQTYSQELSSSSQSAQSGHPQSGRESTVIPPPAVYLPGPKDLLGWSSPLQSRQESRRGLRIPMPMDRAESGFGTNVRNGLTLGTREVDRNEKQVDLNVDHNNEIERSESALSSTHIEEILGLQNRNF